MSVHEGSRAAYSGVRGGGGGGGGIERGEVQWGVGLEGWPGWVTSRGSSELGRLWRA